LRSADLLDNLHGWSVQDLDDDDAVLLDTDRSEITTWKQNYPYSKRMPEDEYEVIKRSLQNELLKMQSWVKDTGQRVVVLFEGRDAAGKGGTIKRFTQHLNPRRPRGGAGETRRATTDPVVFPALLQPTSRRR
jgi:polyphosphate kinase 2 (PPK2 family)